MTDETIVNEVTVGRVVIVVTLVMIVTVVTEVQ